jgi:hypothetical protein
MPVTIPAHVALRTEFREVVSESLGLNEVMERIITIKSWRPSGGEFHGKVSHSPPPWNSSAANAILDLHSWSRQAEVTMRREMSLPYRVRGGSSANTRCALDALVKLGEAVTDSMVYSHKNWLNGWCRKSEIILGTQEAAKRLPRELGQAEPDCPWCKRKTLRQLALEGQIFCVDPTCRDEDGNRPKARLEYSSHVGDFVLVWQDGVLS